jgi:flagellar hook-length control protein FliK
LTKNDAKPSFGRVLSTQVQPEVKSQDESQVEGELEVVASALPAIPANPDFGGTLNTERIPSVPIEGHATKSIPSFTGQNLDLENSVDDLTRRVVWNDFLRKMKEELGVSAEDVLQAFSSLSEDELALPPQQNLDKVVMALGLDPQSTQMAKQYLNDLIVKTKPKSLGSELEASGRQINLTLMTQRELQRRQLDRRLEAMNSSFFIQRPQTAAAPVVAGNPELDPLLAQMQPVNELPQAELSPAPLYGLDSDMMDMPAAMKAKESAVNPIPRGLTTSQAPFTPTPTPTPPSSPTPVVKAEALAVNMSAPMMGLSRSGSAETPTGEDDELTSEGSYSDAALAGENGVRGTNSSGEFRQELNQAAPMASAGVGIRDVVSQAQVMVRDGGGEMKVKLNQDGLGEVAMKVHVEHGKVSVQMITESDEAKRLLERELGDLKNQLQANHLQVDTIKVDTATGLGKQLEQQYQDAQRQMAQQTLEQFRQDHQGWRRSFFEVPGVREYKGQGEAPRDVHAPSVPGRRAGSRRLDLVA